MSDEWIQARMNGAARRLGRYRFSLAEGLCVSVRASSMNLLGSSRCIRSAT